MIAVHEVIAIILLGVVPFIVGKPTSYEDSLQSCLNNTFGNTFEIWNCLDEVATNNQSVNQSIIR